MEAHSDAQYCSFPYGEGLELAEFCLMHRNIVARWHTAMLNGGNRPLLPIRPQDTNDWLWLF
jgi:hypothetical protein